MYSRQRKGLLLLLDDALLGLGDGGGVSSGSRSGCGSGSAIGVRRGNFGVRDKDVDNGDRERGA